ncbi:MAG: acyltransferase [Muribaculaceae bacterium]|nr:acyltransferase [Muribaculaceae bacterium]
MTQTTLHKNTEADPFADIRPYDDHQFKEKIASLVKEPGFEHAVRYVMPDVNYDEFVQNLLTVESQMGFQIKIMGPFLELLVAKTTHGLTMSGEENYNPGMSCTFITNHRDIVLDASFLNLCFIRRKEPLTQVAIGNNLLIFDWITDLVKLNRSFIVKRDTGVRQALEAAKHLSAYIRHVINDMHESVWIAQREGRAKDSNDLTQESVVKMLSLGGPGTSKENLLDLNITPVSISYEYDPNDYLKVREFLLRRRDPDFKKSQRDDLFSMETGLLSQKGRVHFHLGKRINAGLAACASDDRAEVVRKACDLLDRSIHRGYRIFPCNYIAYDEVNGTDTYADMYTADDVAGFDEYIELQLARVDVPDITAEERDFMRTMMLTMYANPLRNQLAAKECSDCD